MADRTSTIHLVVDDQFSAPLAKFAAGMQNMAASSNATAQGVQQMAAAESQMVQAHTQAGEAALANAASHVNLAEKLGLSRREMGMAMSELGSLTGMSPAAIQGIEGLAHSFGLVSVGVIGAVEALKIYQQWLADNAKDEKELSEIRASSSAANLAAKLQDKQALIDLTKQQDELAKKLAETDNLAKNPALAEFAGMSKTQIAGLNGEVARLTGELDSVTSRIDSIQGKSIFGSAKANEVVTFKEQVWDANASLKADAEALDIADIMLKKVAGSGELTVDAFGNLTAWTRDATGALIDLNTAAGHFIENQNMMSGAMAGGDAQMKKFLGDTSYQDNIQKGRDAETARKQSESAAKSYATQQQNIMDTMAKDSLRIFDEIEKGGKGASNNVAKSFSDAFVNIVDAQAKLDKQSGISLIAMQKEYDTVFKAMSKNEREQLLSIMDAGGQTAEGLIKQLLAIAASGEPVKNQLKAIHDLFARLNGMTSTMNLNILTNIRGGGGAGKGGNQQGNQWDFTLEGETYDVRAAYMDMYHDYGTANAAWQRDHQDELKAQGVPNEVPTYAGGVHEMLAGPRLMMAGERGPERVDITPGSGRGQAGQGTTVNVTLQSLVPANEYQLRQIAAQIKDILRM